MCPLMGGITGSISSGSATTIVVNALAGSYPDNYFNGWKLVMPNAANASDVNRMVTAFTGSTATYTWSGNRTDTDYTSETFEVYPPDGFAYQELNDAMNRVLVKTRRTTRIAIPTIPNTRDYPLTGVSLQENGWAWLTLPTHVRAVALRHCPNLLSNSDFAIWGNGPTAAPSQWQLAGGGATIARAISRNAPGKFTAGVTRATNNASLLTRVRYLYTYLQSETVAFGVWCNAASANQGRARFSDGVTTATATSFHSGNSQDSFLQTTQVVNANGLELQFLLDVNGTDGEVSFWNPILVKGSTIDTNLRDYGDDYFKEHRLSGGDYRIDGNVIRLSFIPPEDAQLVVYTAQPFPSISSDSIGNDIPDDVWKWGTLADLARIARPGVERSRWQYDYEIAARAYMSLADRLLQLNPPRASTSVVTGA